MKIEDTKATDIAQDLIKAVGGELSDKNILGVLKVFHAIKEMIDLNWEQYLVQTTNEALTVDFVKCKCRRKLEVVRTRQSVYYSIV